MRWHTLWSFILLLLFSSATYLTYLVSRAGGLNPILINDVMQSDLSTLGPTAFLLDIFVFGLIIRWGVNRRRRKALETSKPPIFVPPMIALPPPEPSIDQSSTQRIWEEMAMLNEHENL